MNVAMVQDLFIKHCGQMQVSLGDLPKFNEFCKEVAAISNVELNRAHEDTRKAESHSKAVDDTFTMLGLEVNCVDDYIDWGYGEGYIDNRCIISCRDKRVEIDTPDYDKFDADVFCAFRDMINTVGEVN